MISSDTAKSRFSNAYGSSATYVTYSPGRIEFIGNHTDYNGGMVLGAALNLGVTVAVAPREDGKLVFASDQNPDLKVMVKPDEIAPLSGKDSWVNYPLGVLKVLLDKGLELSSGFNLYVLSDLPTGAGLSSSAALELASLEAYAALFNYELSAEEKILATQKAENDFVGVPCGMLDQAVSCLGEKDKLVKIDCAEVSFDTVAMPEGLHFWIFNTNQKHSLLDSLYSKRNQECKDALKMIQADGQPAHLAHAALKELEKIEEEEVLKRARHVVTENLRVQSCIEALDAGDIGRVGESLYASHMSSQNDFENSIEEIDTFVSLLKSTDGVIGARLTGGGFGGAAMALTNGSFTYEKAKAIVKAYQEKHPDSPEPTIISVDTGQGTSRLS